MDWLQKSNKAIKTINELDSKVRKCKLNYQASILEFGKDSKKVDRFWLELQKSIQYREGFKAACVLLSE